MRFTVTKPAVLICAAVLSLMACGDDSGSNPDSGNAAESSSNVGAQGGNPDYDYWLNQGNASQSVAKPCNVNGVNNCQFGTLVDSRDGQAYKTIAIGDQVWMAENLNFAAHNSFCVEKDNCKGKGRLYSFGALYDTTSTHCTYESQCGVKAPIQGACPVGWHVPEMREWESLFSNVGSGNYMNVLLKDGAWGDKFPYRDAYGFGLEPSSDQQSAHIGDYTFLFLAYEKNSRYGGQGAYHELDADGVSNSVGGYDYFVPLGFSVRCLQDKAGDVGTPSQMVAEVETRSKAWDYLNQAVEYGTFTDPRDGQVYKTIMAGKNTWMAQNLNFDTGDTTSSCLYDDPARCEVFGRLYSNSAIKAGSLCPAGWGIPTSRQWNDLKELVEYDESRLFARNAWYFLDPDDKLAKGTDELGFALLPSRNAYSAGAYIDDEGYTKGFYSHNSNINGILNDLHSVRCVLDVEP